MSMALPATVPREERVLWSAWAGSALLLSMFTHVLLFLLLRGALLGWGPPLVDPIEPKRFHLERTTIDPRYLREEAQRTMGHLKESEREPVELDPGEVASFVGPLEAPRIPLPVLNEEAQSLSLEAVPNPQDGLTALPLETAGVFEQRAQALAEGATTAALDGVARLLSDTGLAGGKGTETSGQGLPGSDEISALVRAQPWIRGWKRVFQRSRS
ncbi:MAG: hypothetical protein HC901_04295 [Bdellovibrionaceae bacterium]|nr:hypothetical protein [Pseudobdellovibrionaceae bacterium]